MIRKSGHRFSEKIMLNEKIERDDDSTINHLALESAKMKDAAVSSRGVLSRSAFRYEVCWIADSSQLLPRGRKKVHTSVTSSGCVLPSTIRPVVRSSVVSTIE